MQCTEIQYNITQFNNKVFIRLFSVYYRGIFLRVTLYFGEVVVDWVEMKTCQTGIVSKPLFFRDFGTLRASIFQTFARKTEIE